LKIKEAIIKAAEESIGYKKWKNRKWLRTWSDEIQLAIEEKKDSYRNYLQKKSSGALYRISKTPSNSKENHTKGGKKKKERIGINMLRHWKGT